MGKQTLSECIKEALDALNPEHSIENNFMAGFLSGWIKAAMKYETLDIGVGLEGHAQE